MLFKIFFLGLIWLISLIDLIIADHRTIKLRALILSVPIIVSLVVIYEDYLASIATVLGLGRFVDAIIYITLFFVIRLILTIHMRMRKFEILQRNIIAELAKQTMRTCPGISNQGNLETIAPRTLGAEIGRTRFP